MTTETTISYMSRTDNMIRLFYVNGAAYAHVNHIDDMPHAGEYDVEVQTLSRGLINDFPVGTRPRTMLNKLVGLYCRGMLTESDLASEIFVLYKDSYKYL